MELMIPAASWTLASLEAEGVLQVDQRGEGAQRILADITSFHFSFESALLFLSLLIILSIVLDKFGAKIGIPGSIFLFLAGLFFHVTGFSFEAFPIEKLHVVALSILLFFSGLSFDRALLRRNKVLMDSVFLAVFGTFLSMLLWLFYLRIGFGFFQASLGYLRGVESGLVWLISVCVVFSLAVQDWNSFVFVSKRIKGFRGVLASVFKVETAISASISVAFAEILVIAWSALNPKYSTIENTGLLASVFKGILIGCVSGVVLGYLLSLVIRYLLTSKAQLILASVAFTFIGYVISLYVVEQGGYLCALIMGIVTSLSYRSSSGEGEIEFLSETLESLNIASEAILFFAIGLGLQPALFFAHLPIAVYAWIGILLVRPITVALFFRGKVVSRDERRVLASWSPKGAISMALIVTAPALLEETFGLKMAEILPVHSITFMTDVVCGAVIVSMVVKAILVPYLHRKIPV